MNEKEREREKVPQMREKKKVTNIVSFDIGIILNKNKLCISWVRYIFCQNAEQNFFYPVYRGRLFLPL